MAAEPGSPGCSNPVLDEYHYDTDDPGQESEDTNDTDGDSSGVSSSLSTTTQTTDDSTANVEYMKSAFRVSNGRMMRTHAFIVRFSDVLLQPRRYNINALSRIIRSNLVEVKDMALLDPKEHTCVFQCPRCIRNVMYSLTAEVYAPASTPFSKPRLNVKGKKGKTCEEGKKDKEPNKMQVQKPSETHDSLIMNRLNNVKILCGQCEPFVASVVSGPVTGLYMSHGMNGVVDEKETNAAVSLTAESKATDLNASAASEAFATSGTDLDLTTSAKYRSRAHFHAGLTKGSVAEALLPIGLHILDSKELVASLKEFINSPKAALSADMRHLPQVASKDKLELLHLYSKWLKYNLDMDFQSTNSGISRDPEQNRKIVKENQFVWLFSVYNVGDGQNDDADPFGIYFETTHLGSLIIKAKLTWIESYDDNGFRKRRIHTFLGKELEEAVPASQHNRYVKVISVDDCPEGKCDDLTDAVVVAGREVKDTAYMEVQSSESLYHEPMAAAKGELHPDSLNLLLKLESALSEQKRRDAQKIMAQRKDAKELADYPTHDEEIWDNGIYIPASKPLFLEVRKVLRAGKTEDLFDATESPSQASSEEQDEDLSAMLAVEGPTGAYDRQLALDGAEEAPTGFTTIADGLGKFHTASEVTSIKRPADDLSEPDHITKRQKQ